ncbi:DUF732 domain-containing protein [Pseudonocardia sulfidoxydans]|uniref:DUF732 domain-containing protein n=1 Tax=Pseudonocardia sulfidoxydans TaxID=54011 RepID=UPI001649C9A1|nr:DUF732 domain-containing protein [Pseudonocardia sulfidoxydans]
MRRLTIVPAAAAVLFLLAGCGGKTPAEEAFLADVQKSGSEITLSDPDKYLERGHALCDAAKNLKPEDREVVTFMSAKDLGWPDSVFLSATRNLCPDLFPGS